jgi:hypothetical protein
MKIQINILAWLAYWWFPDVKYSREAIEQLCLKVELWSLTKGDLWVIHHLKEIQLLYTRSLCNDPILKSNRIIGIRKDGLPKGLTILNHIFETREDQNVRFTLTLLSIYRTIKAWKDPDVSTITSKYTGLEFSSNDFDPFINKFMRDFNIKAFDVEWSNKDYFYSIKAGPNGKATWMSVIDAINLHEDTIRNLRLLSSVLVLELERWRTFSIKIFDSLKFKPSDKVKTITRKLSVVKDPGGKSRVIAIVDYFSQNVLRLIHNEVFKILKTIPQDRTFTQDPHVDFDGPYYSFDLSAATDRFPLQFQERVVRSLLNNSTKSKAWASILADQEFYVPWEDRFVKYEVGQPMGAYSSWAVFALSHHIIVQYAAYIIGEYPTKKYILLGDDIVIGGKLLADTYKEIIGALGVGISEHKTHVSINTYEFAKRWFRNGIEVSGLQVNAFMETWKSYPLLFQTIRTYYERGLFPKRVSSYPELIENLLVLLGMFERKAQNIARKVEVLHGFYRWIHDDDLATIRKVLVTLHPDEASIPNEEHPIFKHLMFIRLDMSYQVIHRALVSKVEKYMERVPDLLFNDSKTFNPDQIDEFEIDWGALNSPNYVVPKSESFGFSDINNLPVMKSLANISERLSSDPRIAQDQDDLLEHINALVIPELDEIRSKVRGADVLIKQNILAQKVLFFHKVLSRGAWMFEVQGFNKLRINPDNFPPRSI